MKCPKCGKIFQETNDGSLICTPECGFHCPNQKVKKMNEVINFADIVESNGKTIRENNMEKKHKFNLHEKVYANLETHNHQGTSSYKGIVTILDCTRDCDGTPMYTIIKTSIETYECTRDMFHLNDDKMRMLGVCGLEVGIPESILMQIPQHSEYPIDELDYFQQEYEEFIKEGE